MVIERVYLGTWFPRTSSHLKEIHHFLATKEAVGLDRNALHRAWASLGVTKIVLKSSTSDLSYLRATCGEITVFMSEDGIVILSRPIRDSIKREIQGLEKYYIEKFGPALMYLFSRGAPLPKLLTNIKDVYPRVVVTRDAGKMELQSLFEEVGDMIIGSVSARNVDVTFGNTTHVFNLKAAVPTEKFVVEEFLEDVILLRECERQLSGYLHLHRTLWDQISEIHDSSGLNYKDFPRLRGQMLECEKTISFVRARLSQMRDILNARMPVTEQELQRTLQVFGLGRFDTAKANLEYIKDLWRMTAEYARNTTNLLASFSQENTQRELRIIQFITALGLLTGFFGMNIAFPWGTSWDLDSWSFFLTIGMIIVGAAILFLVLQSMVLNRRFSIKQQNEHKKRFPMNFSRYI